MARRSGDQVLSPALTDYTKRAATTSRSTSRRSLQQRRECRRASSWATAVSSRRGDSVPTGTRSYGYPKLLFQMRIEYEDGTVTEIVSDEQLEADHDGPIRANNEYDGEEYDARMEMAGWCEAGLRRLGMAGSARCHGARRRARGTDDRSDPGDPRRSSRSRSRSPSPGVCIFDMGQNMVGWCRLKVAGPRGHGSLAAARRDAQAGRHALSR